MVWGIIYVATGLLLAYVVSRLEGRIADLEERVAELASRVP